MKKFLWNQLHGQVIVFSNEKTFSVDKHINHRNDRYISTSVKDADPEVRFVPRSKHPQSTMMLGFVGSEGKTFPPNLVGWVRECHHLQECPGPPCLPHSGGHLQA